MLRGTTGKTRNKEQGRRGEINRDREMVERKEWHSNV